MKVGRTSRSSMSGAASRACKITRTTGCRKINCSKHMGNLRSVKLGHTKYAAFVGVRGDPLNVVWRLTAIQPEYRQLLPEAPIRVRIELFFLYGITFLYV
jgi:hypothetical protein